MLSSTRGVPRAALLAALFFLAACAPTAEITKGGGATIDEAQAEKYNGPKARITVGRIIDKSGSGKESMTHQLGLLSQRSNFAPDAGAIMGGIRDLVTTALFQSNRFIVLERDAINDVLVEQEFSASGKVGEASRIPMGQIEGAELLVIGAITGFDAAAAGGGGFPIPIPLNRGRDMVVLDLEIRKAFVSMDMRVIDVRTGRVVSTVALEGSARKFGVGLGGFARTRYGGSVYIPGVLRGFTNTPVKKALNE
ncbi:MAG: CsgG/HfaB family protein, partial [Gammaproteobacteria bacterium]|nr:CsgG/HfaB family protein [Gammaproteobacteria bacterium]